MRVTATYMYTSDYGVMLSIQVTEVTKHCLESTLNMSIDTNIELKS